MSTKKVGLTPGQKEAIGKMASDKGIQNGRFQLYGLDNGNVATFLEAVKLGREGHSRVRTRTSSQRTHPHAPQHPS